MLIFMRRDQVDAQSPAICPPPPDVDESAHRPLPPHLLSEELWTWGDPQGKLEPEWLARFRSLGIQRSIILLKAMQHSCGRSLDTIRMRISLSSARVTANRRLCRGRFRLRAE